MADAIGSESAAVVHPTRPPSVGSGIPSPRSSAATPAWVGGNKIGGNVTRRSYEQIISDSSSNILIRITIQKVINTEDPNDKPQSLSISDVGELIFDFLEIDPADCLELDLSTGGRYDTKELLLKGGAKLGKANTVEPLEFKRHKVNTTVVTKVATKVIFKNVPISVPDEEILHLCSQYGEVKDDKVRREIIHFGGARKVKLQSSTRWVLMNLQPGKAFRNFYWLAGPQPGDVSRRITVLHPGQPKQCSWCLKYPRPSSAAPSAPTADYCSRGGNGKLCEDADTPRCKLSDYAASLEAEGYKSLKAIYLEGQAALRAAFPPLLALSSKTNSIVQMPNDVVDERVTIENVGDEESQVGSGAILEADIVQINNNVDVEIPPTAPLAISTSNSSALFSPTPTTSTQRKLSISTSTPSLKERSQPFLKPAAKKSPLNQRGKIVGDLSKPLLTFFKDGTEVGDAAVKAFVEWSVANGNVGEGTSGERMPILNFPKGGKFDERLERRKALETRMKEHLQVMGKSNNWGKDRARSFSQSGLDDSMDQDSSLKSPRVHSPPKS